MADNLELKPSSYYAVLHVPKDVREVLGRMKYSKSLGTLSKKKADRLAAPLLSRWRAEIDNARGDSNAIVDEGLRWKEAYADLKLQGTSEVFHGFLGEKEASIKAERGTQEAELFVKVALDKAVLSQPLFDRWKSQAFNLKPSTLKQRISDITLLVNRFPDLLDMTPKNIRQYFRYLADEEGKTWVTLNRYQMNFKAYCHYHDLIHDMPDPFVNLLLDKKASSRKLDGTSYGSWSPITPEQVVQVWTAAGQKRRPDRKLQDLIYIAAYTGMRIEEICCLKVSDVTEESFRVTDSKTKAGLREVPIHSQLKPVIDRLKATAIDQYLLVSEKDTTDIRRSVLLSGRFSKLKQSLGFQDDEVCHSIRKTFITLLDQAGVLEGVTADIVGHEKNTIVGAD